MDKIPRYILWSKDQIDLSDEWQRRWHIRQVLMYGRAEDVASLDWDEVERLLPELHLPPPASPTLGELLPCSKKNRFHTLIRIDKRQSPDMNVLDKGMFPFTLSC